MKPKNITIEISTYYGILCKLVFNLNFAINFDLAEFRDT